MTFLNRQVGNKWIRHCIALGGVLPPAFQSGILEDLLQIWRGQVDSRFQHLFDGHGGAAYGLHVRSGARAPPSSPATRNIHSQGGDDEEESLNILCASADVATLGLTQVGNDQSATHSDAEEQGSDSQSGFDFQGERDEESDAVDEGREVFIHPCASDEAEQGSSDKD